MCTCIVFALIIALAASRAVWNDVKKTDKVMWSHDAGSVARFSLSKMSSCRSSWKKKTPTKKDEVLVRDVEPKQKMCLCVRTGWTAVVISDLKESRKVEIKLWWENPAASVHELQTMAITFGLNPSQCRINGKSFKKQSSLFFFFFCFNCKEEATTPLRSTFPSFSINIRPKLKDLQHAGSRPQMVNDCQKMC